MHSRKYNIKNVVKEGGFVKDGLDSAGTGFGPDAGSCKQDNEHESSGTYSPPIINLLRTG